MALRLGCLAPSRLRAGGGGLCLTLQMTSALSGQHPRSAWLRMCHHCGAMLSPLLLISCLSVAQRGGWQDPHNQGAAHTTALPSVCWPAGPGSRVRARSPLLTGRVWTVPAALAVQCDLSPACSMSFRLWPFGCFVLRPHAGICARSPLAPRPAPVLPSSF